MTSIIKSVIFAAFLVLPVKGVYASVWQSPVVIDSGHEDAYRTDIKFDSDGNAIAIFEQGFNINRRPTNRILATVFDSPAEKRKR